MAASSAQYVIDVAVAMPAGEATAAQLDDLSKALLASGANADNFHDAIAQASNALAAARQASQAATAALGAGNAAYKDLEQAALQTAKAQEKAAKLGVVPPNVAADAQAATAAVNAYALKLATIESAATSAAADEAKLTTQLKQVQQAADVGAKALASQARAVDTSATSHRNLVKGLREVGGPLGDVVRRVSESGTRFHELSEAVGGGNASMLVAAGAASTMIAVIAAVTVVVIAATVAIAAWSVGLADSARNADLSQQALEALNPKYKAISASLQGLTDDTGQTRAQLDGLAKSLIDAHVSAANMPAALRAAALAETALGNGGAQQFIDKIKEGTLTVNKFANTAQQKFGGIVAEQMLSLGSQSARLKDELTQVFGGLNIDPVLKGVQKLVALFDENTAAGSAMKLLFGKVFQPLIDNAENAATVIEAFVLGFLIGLTKLYIAIKPAIRAVSEFLGFHSPSLATTLATVTKAAEYIAPVFVVIVVALAALAAAASLAFGVLAAGAAALAALPAIVIAVALALVGVFVKAWLSVRDFLSGIDLATVGHDIITGLVNGLLAAGPAVVHAISGVVGGAIDSAKHLLGIASPSKVFGEIGVNTVEGYAKGVDANADVAQSSVAAAIAPPDTAGQSALAQQTAQQSPRAFGGAGAPAAGGSSSSSSSKSISLTGPFIFNGVTGAEDAESRFGEMLTRLLEGDATQLGHSPEPA